MMSQENALSLPECGMGSDTRSMREQVEDVMNRHVTPALGEAADQTEAALRDAAEELRAQLARLTQSVRRQPLTAIALAALAGFVIARLTER